MHWIVPGPRVDRGPTMDNAYRWLQSHHQRVGYEVVSIDRLPPTPNRSAMGLVERVGAWVDEHTDIFTRFACAQKMSARTL